jgi:enterochelin esterase-like enzyme
LNKVQQVVTDLDLDLLSRSHYKRRIIVFCWLLLNTALLSIPLIAQTVSCTQNGTLNRETYSSQRLQQTMYYSVYVPPCYSETETYPTLYLLHGSNEDDGHWQRLGLPAHLDTHILQDTLPPMIVVMPFGNVIANRNRFDEISWGQIFIHELMPDAESKYAIAKQKPYRAIGGISRGGFWAYHIALTHPHLFDKVGGHSAYFDAFASPPEANPLDLVANVSDESMQFWLDYGADDFARDGLVLMNERMLEAQIPHIYQVYDAGEHNNAYWSSHLDDYMAFYAGDWREVQTTSLATSTPDSVISTGFATSTPSAPAPSTQANRLYVPIVATDSLRISITQSELQQIIEAKYDADLILSDSTVHTLHEDGIVLHADIQQIADDELWAILARQRATDVFTLLPFDALPLPARLLLVDDRSLFDQLADYPFFITSTTPNFDENALTRIMLSGVTALTRNTRIALQNITLEDAVSGVEDVVHAVDFFHISNEVSFVEDCPDAPDLPRLGGSSSFCSEWRHAPIFNLLDVDIIELTGNHNNDYGYDAYQQTYEYYQEQGFTLVGGGLTPEQARKPLLLEHNGHTVAWVACNVVGPYYALANDDPLLTGGIRPGANACDWQDLEATLLALRENADVIIVTIQHQEFETYVPTEQQRFDFRRLAELGADVVIGTAPHKPQIFEWYVPSVPTGRSAFLHYGLGNLFFDQPFWGNQRFFMDSLVIYEGRLMTIELFTGIIEENVRPRWMTEEERYNFLHYLLIQQER